MSDEDEQDTNFSSNPNSSHEIKKRRLFAIKLKLHELTREKTKYNVEKLAQDGEFLRSEILHLSKAIADINKKINAQTNTKRNLHAKMQILRSTSRLRFANLKAALAEKQRYEKELEKTNKSDDYRDLVRKNIESIDAALPQLQELDIYIQELELAENEQVSARDKREKLQEILNDKSRKDTERRQLLIDSEIKLPEIEQEISALRVERDKISSSMGNKKQRNRSSATQEKPLESPVSLFKSLEQDTFEHEKRHHTEQLEKIRLLLNYFHEKMTEHNISTLDTPTATPTSELISPLYQPVTPYEEQTILSSYMDEHDYESNPSIKTTKTNQPAVAIAMKLPRNFTPLDISSTVANQIIHSPHYAESPIEYKKELPSDIVDKYAGVSKKKQQQSSSGKKNKKNKKNFAMTHSSQMVTLYNDIRTSTGNSDTLPSMPMYEYELSPTIKALRLMEQSVESYLNELSKRNPYNSLVRSDEENSDILEDDDIRDSALDTFSEESSLIDTTNMSNESTPVHPLLINIPGANSSSSSDDKKTIVSSSSPPSSNHSNSKLEHPTLSTVPLTTVEELPTHIPSLTMQIAQIDRQISDEGYRSVRNEQQTKSANYTNSPSLTRSQSYTSAEKVGQWLSSATASLFISNTNETVDFINDNPFQATDMNDEENMIESTIPVSND